MTKNSKTKSEKNHPKNPEKNLTPKQIVEELNRYIVGQNEAKKAVAIALRNRYRRKLVESPLREEIVPKNILMIGPTGVGKTEVARRLAKLANAPFIKVEATKSPTVSEITVSSTGSEVRDISVSTRKKRKHCTQCTPFFASVKSKKSTITIHFIR